MLPTHIRKALTVALFALSVTTAAYAAPIFMKYDGVDGDVQRGKDRWIEIHSYQFAVDREGKPSCASQSGTFTMDTDSKALPALMQAAAKGKVFRQVTVDSDGEIHSLQGARVKKIDALTVKQKVVELTYGRCLTHAKPSSKK